ncbi:MAG: twin-arginine translocase TatA/TatE family subunit [Pseudomonadales bacterium]|jgi:sec-independent protein translocase protein TatA|nr:twin-arginine translocase TatA/TatE family subunit [Pseudomonadales bacterium]
MFGLSVTELMIILAIVLLLFGTKKLRNLGGDLGGAIKGFRKAMTDDEAAAEKKKDDAAPDFIEGEVHRDGVAEKREAAADRKS